MANLAKPISLPEKITLTVTKRCNYRCRMCYQTDYTSEIDWAVVEKVAPLLPFAHEMQIFGGEPLSSKYIQKLYQLAHVNECNIHMVSNGSLLTDAMVKNIVDNRVFHIKFSIDAGTPQTYKHIRGGNFFKVLAGIGAISQEKLRQHALYPIMDFNFLAMRCNVHELSRLIVMGKELGIRAINVFYPTMHSPEMVAESLFLHQNYGDEQLMKAVAVARNLQFPLLIPPLFTVPREEIADVLNCKPTCEDPWTTLIVDVDGTISQCCAGAPILGSLLENDFATLWNGAIAQSLRKTINTPAEPAYCKRCRLRKQDPSTVGYHIANPEWVEQLKQHRVPAPAMHLMKEAMTQGCAP